MKTAPRSTPARSRASGPARRPTAEIRAHLLDHAERLFAEHGFHGVAVRTITEAAGSRLADVSDHFGGKDGLFREVVRRRAAVINADREALLAQRPTRGSRLKQMQALVEAFARPWLDHVTQEPGWTHYLRLIAQLNTSRSPVLAMVADQFNPVALRFVAELQALAPEAPPDRLLRGYQFMLSAALAAFANNHRVDVLSDSRYTSADFTAQYRDMVTCVAGGLTHLLHDTHSP